MDAPNAPRKLGGIHERSMACITILRGDACTRPVRVELVDLCLGKLDKGVAARTHAAEEGRLGVVRARDVLNDVYTAAAQAGPQHFECEHLVPIDV